MPSANGCIIVPRPVVVPVQTELAVELLVPVGHVREKAVVLEALHVAVRALREQGTIGVVVIDLLHASALGNYHSIVAPIGRVREKALMIRQVEMVDGVSSTAEGEISVFRLSHRKAVVGEYIPVYVVRRCRYAYSGRLVRDLQLRSAGTIHIDDDPAVAVGDAARQVQGVLFIYSERTSRNPTSSLPSSS